MVSCPVALGILQSSHFAAFDQFSNALMTFRVNVTIGQLRRVSAELGVAKGLLTCVLNIHALFNLEVGRLTVR